jgi:hypothetical protein
MSSPLARIGTIRSSVACKTIASVELMAYRSRSGRAVNQGIIGGEFTEDSGTENLYLQPGQRGRKNGRRQGPAVPFPHQPRKDFRRAQHEARQALGAGPDEEVVNGG